MTNKIKSVMRSSMLRIIGRLFFYGLSLSIILWFDGILEIAVQASAISLFLVVAAVYELLSEKHLMCGKRYFFYLACVAGILISGLALIRSANTVKSHNHDCPHYEIIQDK